MAYNTYNEYSFNGQNFRTLVEYRKAVHSLLKAADSALAWDLAWDWCLEHDNGCGDAYLQELLQYETFGESCDRDILRLESKIIKILKSEGIEA